MISLKQPSGSNLCGQTCVAMLAETSIDEVKKIMGGGRTRTAQVVAALRHYGIDCSGRLTKYYGKLPEVCIARLRIEWSIGTSYHWTLWYKGKWYDPSPDAEVYMPDGQYHEEYAFHILSYLEVKI